MNYKLGLCSVSFRKNSPKEILQKMQESGLSYIEWGSDIHLPQNDAERAQSIAKLQTQYGIKCSSYGTYFRIGINPAEELFGYIETAKNLGTSILRLWCGSKNSEEYSQEEKAELFNECRLLSQIAGQHGVTLCMECHGGTFTNTPDSALELMQSVNSECFKMYWQPNQYRTYDDNIESAKRLAPYTINIHVFHWRGEDKFPLCEGKLVWQQYLAQFSGEQILLLEFMPDGRIESLKAEAEALKLITEQK